MSIFDVDMKVPNDDEDLREVVSAAHLKNFDHDDISRRKYVLASKVDS